MCSSKVYREINYHVVELFQTDKSYLEDNQQKELHSNKFDATAPS